MQLLRYRCPPGAHHPYPVGRLRRRRSGSVYPLQRFQGDHFGRRRTDGEHVRLRVQQEAQARHLRPPALRRFAPPLLVDESRPFAQHRPFAACARRTGHQKSLRRVGDPLRSHQRGQAPRLRLPQGAGAPPYLRADEGRPGTYAAARSRPDGQTGEADARRF